jgi:hypothetical protein
MTEEKRIEIMYDTHDGYGVMCARVDDYEQDYVREGVINPDEIVIPDEETTILFTYPLSRKVEFTYTQKGGFTRMNLYRCIYEGYKKIYDAEEEAVGDPGTYEMLYNRRTSEGPYGIWGHYMNDLIIEFVLYYPESKSVRLLMGS